MIILPDRNIQGAKILMSVPMHEWRSSSQSQPKDCFGRENTTRFRVRARLNDGHIAWVGWFDDRADFDQFLWSIATGELWHDPYVQRLPTPWWPGLDPLIGYDFATVTFLTSPTGSNQTFTSPSDWGNGSNTIELIGGGASGAGTGTANQHVMGGGGASYAAITSFTFASPGTTTATYRIAAAVTGTVSSNGTNGNPSWFNDTADPGGGTDNLKCGAKGGSQGLFNSGSQNGGAGGVTATSYGQTKFAGGRGGNLTGASGAGASGGGGAAGPNGVGLPGGDSSSTSTIGTAGGNGDNGSGGAGGGSNVDGSPGTTEWTSSPGGASAGPGGGGGGRVSGGTPGRIGGLYGAAGGGCFAASGVGGTGTQGIIVITYTPQTDALGGNQQIFMM